jgi:predicted nucleic acid-binding protein
MRRLDFLRPYRIGISIVSIAELYEGILNSPNQARDERELAEFLRSFPIINLNVSICRIFGAERARLRAAGTPIGDFDLLIGATALHRNLTLLTNNHRHSERLSDLRIISV